MLAKSFTTLSASPTFHFLFLFFTHSVDLGGMTGSHSVGPQMNFKDPLYWHEKNASLNSYTHKMSGVLLATLWENKVPSTSYLWYSL